MSDNVTFSFGENWCDYLKTVTEEEVNGAMADIRTWLSQDDLVGKTVVDIGSGSGIHSLAFHRLGVSSLHSLDVDPRSVQATRTLWQGAGRPDNWRVEQASVLDQIAIESLGTFDVVYSWGVLHHTGNLWLAMEHAASLVRPGGLLWIAIYMAGSRYPKDLALKRKYNALSESGKQWMVRRWILRDMWRRLRRWKNPFGWFSKSKRGMNSYHDLIDWLGGLPYEVADPNEIIAFGRQRGLMLERIRVAQQGACSIYALRSVPELARVEPEQADHAA